MKAKSRRTLLSALLALLVGVGVMQQAVIFPFWQKNYVTKAGDFSELAPDQLLAVFAGFREMIAGILWVRADSFFEEGNYDAILPIIRIVTLLDPKQIDVYVTGMWHIAYNFTDEGSRADRRYVPSALALGKEGARNNPNTYELFFETGWLWFHRIDDDHSQAVRWFEEAMERPDMPPEGRRNLLPVAQLRNGEVMSALETYERFLADANKRFAADPQSFGNRQQRDTVENNLDNLLVRMGQRGWFAQQAGTFDQGEYDTKPPFDVGFSANVVAEDSRVLRVRGTWNVQPVGTRVRFILRDADMQNTVPGGMVWDQGDVVDLDPPRNVTYLQDALFVRNQQFEARIDLSRDPTMYPLASDEYVLEFFYSPRSAPPHIQDKFGFSGEGMTDSNFLNTDVRPGQRVVFAQLRLTRDQIRRIGRWAPGRETPSVSTPNWRPDAVREDTQAEDIIVPGLRARP